MITILRLHRLIELVIDDYPGIMGDIQYALGYRIELILPKKGLQDWWNDELTWVKTSIYKQLDNR